MTTHAIVTAACQLPTASSEPKTTTGADLMAQVVGKLSEIKGVIGQGHALTGDTAWVSTAYSFVDAFGAVGMLTEAAIAVLAQYSVVRERWMQDHQTAGLPEETYPKTKDDFRGKLLRFDPLIEVAKRAAYVAQEYIICRPPSSPHRDISDINQLQYEIGAYELVGPLLDTAGVYAEFSDRINYDGRKRSSQQTLDMLRARLSAMQEPHPAIE